MSLLLVILLDVSDAAGQTGATWAQSLSSNTFNAGSDVAVAPSGDVYFAGSFQEGFYMGDSRNEMPASAGASDVWLTRMAASQAKPSGCVPSAGPAKTAQTASFPMAKAISTSPEIFKQPSASIPTSGVPRVGRCLSGQI